MSDPCSAEHINHFFELCMTVAEQLTGVSSRNTKATEFVLDPRRMLKERF